MEFRNKKAYGLVAEEYFQRRPLLIENNEKVINNLLKHLEIKENLSVLDVGVGSGLDLEIFNNNGFKTYGTDISEKMIELARINSPNSQYYLGNFLDLEFGRKFSVIYAQAFIHLFPKGEIPKIFEKMYSILENNGLIHFSTTIHSKPSEGLEEKKDYKEKVKRFRKRWALNELNEFLETLESVNLIHQYLVKDPMGKNWVNTIVGC